MPIHKILAGILVLGAFDMPYDYYIFLRFALCFGSAYLLYKNWDEYEELIKIGLIVSIFLFNPFSPFYFEKETWVIVDLVLAGLMFFIDEINKKQKNKLEQKLDIYKTVNKQPSESASLATKIFNESRSTSARNYFGIATVEDAAKEVAINIYDYCLDEVNGIIVTNDAIVKDLQLPLMMLFGQGLIQLIDMSIFINLPAKRNEFMDLLVMNYSAKIVTEYSGENITTEQKHKLALTIIDSINQVMLFLGQFKKVSYERDEPVSGTLLWEFGLLFAEKIGFNKDYIYAKQGGVVLLRLFDKLNMNMLYKQIA